MFLVSNNVKMSRRGEKMS